MTFLHKLARRLARLKAGTVVAVAVVPAAAAFVSCELAISEPLPTVSRLVVSPKTVTLTPDESQDFADVTAGRATITATSEGRSGTSAITVTASPAPPGGSCLTWAGATITLSGLSTSPYQNTGLASGTKLDATTAQWILDT